MAIIQVTTKEFRAELARMLDLADSGEQIIINRCKKAYMLIPISYSDFNISPELQKRIDDAHQSIREGESVKCSTKEELDNFLESLHSDDDK